MERSDGRSRPAGPPLADGRLVSNDSFVAAYVLEAWLRRRCLHVRVTGPSTNRIELKTTGGGCTS